MFVNEVFLLVSGNTKKNSLLAKSLYAAAIVVFASSVTAPLTCFFILRAKYQKDRSQVSYVKGVIKKNNTGLAAVEEEKLATVIIDVSREYSIDPALVLAIIKTESRFNNWARSRKGAVGLMQLMPDTGREVAESIDVQWRGAKTLYDPYNNVRMGVHYYSALKERFENDMHTLAAYNAGARGAIARARLKGSMARNYAEKVMDNYREIKEGSEEF